MFAFLSPSSLLKSSLLALVLVLAGCNNDTGSSVLPGGGHDHEHSEITSKVVGTPLRVTQIAGHPDVAQFAAFATGNKVMYLVSPERNLYEIFDWSDGSNATRSQHIFDAHGEHFLVLDTDGKLHILETGDSSAEWSYKAGIQAVTAASITAGAKITVSQAEGKAFITDPDPAYAANTSKIQVVDLEAGTLLAAIDLDFVVSKAGIAWTGIAAEHDHDHGAGGGHDDHPGRLIIASNGAHSHAYVYDLESAAVLADDFHLDYEPSALYASPGHRYAVIAQQPATASHQVQFLDSGIHVHDDHVDADAPALLSFKLYGTTPAHYRSVDGVAALFFDGGSGPRFVLFSDASLAAGNVIASENIMAAHHGIAEPRGEVVLASKADRSGILLYHLHDDHFHEEGSVEQTCTGLHGGGSNAGWSAFGCQEGVLLVGLTDDDSGHSH